jgi:steroid 5-alpha reductase family enzyme
MAVMPLSGKAMLEGNLNNRRPRDGAYVEQTSGFFPRPPRRAL